MFYEHPLIFHPIICAGDLVPDVIFECDNGEWMMMWVDSYCDIGIVKLIFASVYLKLSNEPNLLYIQASKIKYY